MDTQQASDREVRARFMEHVHRFFPKYDIGPTGTLRPGEMGLGVLDPNIVDDFINFLNDTECQPLMRLTYIPITYTSDLAQVGCGICKRPYSDRLHVPVKLRCGCVYGEGCVVWHLMNTVNSLPKAAPSGQPVFRTCRCVAPGCTQAWAPLYEWYEMQRRHPGLDRQSWPEEFERMERGKFLDVMWNRWMEIAFNEPALSRPMLIIQDDEGAVRTAHDGIMHPNYRPMGVYMVTRAWGDPILRDGRIWKYLAKYFAQSAGERFYVNDETVRVFRDATVAHIACLLDETKHDRLDQTLFILERYTEKLIKHTLVQMRINMKMFF